MTLLSCVRREPLTWLRVLLVAHRVDASGVVWLLATKLVQSSGNGALRCIFFFDVTCATVRTPGPVGDATYRNGWNDNEEDQEKGGGETKATATEFSGRHVQYGMQHIPPTHEATPLVDGLVRHPLMEHTVCGGS